MKLLAVSGGPDSMALLYKYRNKKIVVAHVNYKKRLDADKEEKLVRKYCQEHKIPLEVLQLSKPIETGNFQAQARVVRYDFFKKVYQKYNCNQLLVAHHKDDFLETALMQHDSKRNPSYYGIRQKITLNGLKIYRPFLDCFWKEQLEQYCNKKNIPYGVDQSNFSSDFARNVVRKKLLTKSFKEKKALRKWFLKTNQILIHKEAKINHLFKKWEASQFTVSFFSKQLLQEELLFKFIHHQNNQIKLSRDKIINIIKFVLSERPNGIYKLNNQFVLEKVKNQLLLKNISN